MIKKTKKARRIPQALIRRLPRYYRYLEGLSKDGVDRISSNKLGQLMETTASQVRQDLSSLGEFGQHGFGYNVSELKDAIAGVLGINKVQNVIIIGAGRMGQAVSSYGKLNRAGFDIIGIFDKDKKVVGREVNELVVQDMGDIDRFAAHNRVDIGIICISNNEGAMVGEKLISLGIKAIWNFSPIDLKFSSDVVVENVHLTESLMVLSYKAREKEIVNDIVEDILKK